MIEKSENRKRGKVYFTQYNASYLPSIAETCGYEIKININNSLELMFNEILNFSPDFIVSIIRFKFYKPQMEALAKIKELLPKTKIIVTGEPFLTYNNNVTYENPFISYAITGEPEYTLRDILNGTPDNEILGICYTDDNMQSVKNEPRPFIDNLDELPFPIRITDKNSVEYIEVSRGCPHHCFFCMATPLRGKVVRYRSVENVIKEIEFCIEKYGVTEFVFKADNICEDRTWFLNLCKKIIENKLNINWSTNIMPGKIDNELAKLMKESGCVLCNIGAESGSLSIINNIEKHISLEDIKETNQILKQNKISINNCFLFGLPWETEETAEENIKFALELNSDEATFNIAAPFPGTKFFVYTMLNRLISGELDFTNSIKGAIVRTHKLSKEKITECMQQALRRYYIRPKYILKTLLTLNFKLLARMIKIYFLSSNKNIKNLKREQKELMK